MSKKVTGVAVVSPVTIGGEVRSSDEMIDFEFTAHSVAIAEHTPVHA